MGSIGSLSFTSLVVWALGGDETLCALLGVEADTISDLGFAVATVTGFDDVLAARFVVVNIDFKVRFTVDELNVPVVFVETIVDAATVIAVVVVDCSGMTKN